MLRAGVKISVEDPRPVAKAITLLESRFGWVITYEDPRYINPADLSDVTEKVRRDLHKFKPGKAPKVLIPKGGTLDFEYLHNANSKTTRRSQCRFEGFNSGAFWQRQPWQIWFGTWRANLSRYAHRNQR